MSENKRAAYNNAFNRDNYTGVSFRLNNRTEQDVIDVLKSAGSVKAYIVKLIRTDQRRRDARNGRVFNNGDRRMHENIDKYPFEVVEFIRGNDRYTVGFADCIENAQAMLSTYASRQQNAGPLKIYERRQDPDLNCVYAVEVTI